MQIGAIRQGQPQGGLPDDPHTSPEPHVLRNCVGIGINDAGDHKALGQLETDELAHEIVLFLAQRAADQDRKSVV